jgi:hypothetical protein
MAKGDAATVASPFPRLRPVACLTFSPEFHTMYL